MSQKNQPQNVKDYTILVLQGIVIGAANAIPGVSGGTMALILGIYEELINSLKTLGDKQFWQAALKFRLNKLGEYLNWRFLLTLALGVVLAVVLLAQLLEYLLAHKSIWVWSFFFGLITASVFSVGARVKKWRIPTILSLIIGAAVAFSVVGLTPAKTPENLVFLFISGAVAACAFILPGISGAFILVLMGKYEFAVHAVNQKDMLSLLVLLLGGTVGLIIFAQFLNWLFKRYHDLAIALLTGFIVGSLRKVWPWQIDNINVLPTWQINNTINVDILYALLFAIAGIAIVAVLDAKTILRS